MQAFGAAMTPWWDFTSSVPDGVDKTHLFSDLQAVVDQLQTTEDQAMQLFMSTAYKSAYREHSDQMRVNSAWQELREAVRRVKNVIETMKPELIEEQWHTESRYTGLQLVINNTEHEQPNVMVSKRQAA